jgi:hypothetical protein
MQQDGHFQEFAAKTRSVLLPRSLVLLDISLPPHPVFKSGGVARTRPPKSCPEVRQKMVVTITSVQGF